MKRSLTTVSLLAFLGACAPGPSSISGTSTKDGNGSTSSSNGSTGGSTNNGTGSSSGSGGSEASSQETIATGTGTLSTLTSFTNPGALNMYTYVPKGALSGALVVAMHGCTQSATDYMKAGWSNAADAFGFVVLYPEQTSTNNSNKCFNFFDSADTQHNGEALSIANAIQTTLDANKLDAQRVYVTGLSAGGAMTAVMLANYPDKGTSHTTFTGFNGGAVMAGLPFNTACTGQDESTCPAAGSYGDAFTAMASGKSSVTAQQWGDRVRNVSPSATQWPRVSIWAGTSDTTVNPANADELVQQFSNLHGLTTQTGSDTVDGATHTSYADSNGVVQVEEYKIPNMTHGTAIDPSFDFGSANSGAACGSATSYILSAGICSTFHALVFWGEIDNTDGGASTGGTTGGSTGGTTTGGSTSGTTVSATCTAVTASNSDHVAAGRALDMYGFAYTTGTYQYLGADNAATTSTVHQQYGIWLSGPCL